MGKLEAAAASRVRKVMLEEIFFLGTGA